MLSQFYGVLIKHTSHDWFLHKKNNLILRFTENGHRPNLGFGVLVI